VKIKLKTSSDKFFYMPEPNLFHEKIREYGLEKEWQKASEENLGAG